MVPESNNGAETIAVGPANRRDRRDIVAVDTSMLFQIDERDAAPTYIQIERRVRIAVADGVLKPDDALPSVRNLAAQLGVSPNTVGRAYADLAREGVIVARAGGGSAIAPLERLDHPSLQRTRQDRLLVLTRRTAVRGLALGFDASHIVEALKARARLARPRCAADGATHTSGCRQGAAARQSESAARDGGIGPGRRNAGRGHPRRAGCSVGSGDYARVTRPTGAGTWSQGVGVRQSQRGHARSLTAARRTRASGLSLAFRRHVTA
jgi:GntR family transcriptional regulator